MQNKYIDFIEYFTKIAKYPSFELLVKLKLFDLAKEANMFYQGKSFQEIMGIPKSFYPFIKKHNIDYKQLEILQLIQLEDIKLIKALTKFDISTLKAIAKFVPLEKAYKNILRINKNREHEYRDYLRGCLKIGYDMKSKKVLYPANLRMAHDKVSDLLIMVENEANDRLIKERCLSELNNYIYKSKKFIIFPANSVESLVNESRQQKHCVRDYCSDYAVGETDIYFMRLLAHQDKSLVTIEVQDKKVVQSRIFDNEDPTKEQMAFINRWQNRILLAS